MFGKLLKHEFRATARIIPLSWAAMVVIVGLYMLVNKLEIVWLQSTSIVFVVIAVVAVSLIAVCVVAARFYQTVYKNESYLTHTLPVTAGQILWSKVLTGVFWICISAALTIGGLIVLFIPLYESDPSIRAMVDFYLNWAKQIGIVPVISVAILIGILSCVDSVAQIFTAITLGNLPGNQKHSLALSVVFYLLINQVLSTTTGVISLLLPPALRISATGVELVMSVPFRTLMDMAESGAAFFDYGLVGIVLQYTMDFVMLFLVKRLLEKRLSVK